MIKTIDAENITPEMRIAYFESRKFTDANDALAHIIKAAPEVKPIDLEEIPPLQHKDIPYNAEEWECGMIYLDSVGIPRTVKGEPLSIVGRMQLLAEMKAEPFCYTHKNAQVEFDHGLSARIADFQDDYWIIPLYLHPPAQSYLVERIRALEIAEPMGWMDRCHNGVVAKIVELIEVTK